MKSEFLLKDEFKKWLIETEKTSEASAKSYLSYVSGADKLISISGKGSNEKFNLFAILQSKFKKQDTKAIEETIFFVIDELSIKNAEDVFGRPKKTLQNYKSGLYSYLEFLLEQSFPVGGDEIEIVQGEIGDLHIFTDAGKSSSENNVVKVHSKHDLIKNFSLRIKTQDRFYEDIFFPIRFITRVFSMNNERNVFKNWLNHLLNSIAIFLEVSNTTFAEITSLTISNNRVYIAYQGIEKTVYTKLSDNKTLVPFEIKTLNKIAIDHDRSLFDVMNANLNHLPTILQITNELKKHIQGKVNYQKLSKASHSDKLDEFIKTINTQNLLKELELIASETNLQLMDSSQNTSKGKK
jgi:hypothetical protein